MQLAIPVMNVSAEGDVAKIIGNYIPLRESRKVLRAACPFHADAGLSLMVYPAKNYFKCFGCGTEGGALEFVMAWEGKNQADAAKTIAAMLINWQTEYF